MQSTSTDSQRQRGLPRSFGYAAILVLLVGACSGGDAAAPSPTTVSSTAAVDDDGTSTSSTEPIETTTTAASDEDRVLEAILEYRSYHERLGNPADPNAAIIDEVLTGAIRDRAMDTQSTNFVEGNYYEGGYEIEVYDIEIDGESARAMACAHDQITKRGPDGSALLPPHPAPLEYDFQLERVDGAWKISDVTSYRDDPCDLVG